MSSEPLDWGQVYAHTIACTGWTWDYIAEHMDIPRLEALKLYWRENPPLHMMVKAYLFGGEKKEKEATMEDLFAMGVPEA